MHQGGGDYHYAPSPPPYYNYTPPPPPTPPSNTILPPPPQNYHSTPLPPPSFASAPPFATSDYSSYPQQNYPSTPHFPDHIPPPPPPQQQFQTTSSYYPPNYDSPNYPHYDPPDYPPTNPSTTPSYTSQYEHGSGYFDDNLSGYPSYGSTKSNLGGGYENYGNDDGVYAYQGKNDPYGARGTTNSKPNSSNSSNWSGLFDDYGRPVSFPKEEKERKSSSGSSYSANNSYQSGIGRGSDSGSLKVVRAVPKVEDKSDGKSGVQKFRVKLLPETGGQGVLDVLCMVGLDGIRMLDPNTSRTLRIYPLETVTRCDKIDSSTFAFWSKTSVDIEPRRIRLQSNSCTTNTILDTVTAATVQFKEMGGRFRSSETPKALELPSEKKKGLGDWIYKLKPVNEEKDHWVPDEAASKCTGCGSDFSAFNRRHHCRNCGDVFCDKCTQGRTPLTSEEDAQPVRVCDRCMAEVTHRLSKAKEAASRPVTLQSHEDLAKKLQEEMEKNLKISSGSKSESSSKRMREVACPTCTVHLQVQVPSSGSETIECGVCQQPFIVSAH